MTLAMEEIRGWILTNHNIRPKMLFYVINPNVAVLFYESERNVYFYCQAQGHQSNPMSIKIGFVICNWLAHQPPPPLNFFWTVNS